MRETRGFVKVEITSLILQETLLTIRLSRGLEGAQDREKARIGGDIYKDQADSLAALARLSGKKDTITYLREDVLPEFLRMKEEALKRP